MKNGSPMKGRTLKTECKCETSETNHIDVEAAKTFIRRIPWNAKDELKTWITSKMQNVIFKSSIGFSFANFTKELEEEEKKILAKIKEEEMKNQVNKEEKTYRGWFRVKQIKKIRKRKKVCLYCKGIECHKNKEENEKCKEEKLKEEKLKKKTEKTA